MATPRTPQAMYGVVATSQIIGEKVVDREDEKLGKIEELVIDANTGHLAYAVLAFGDKRFAIPWDAFEFANTEHKLILNVDRVKLDAAPGFDKKDTWPDFADQTWGGEIHDYYGTKPYWAEQNQ